MGNNEKQFYEFLKDKEFALGTSINNIGFYIGFTDTDVYIKDIYTAQDTKELKFNEFMDQMAVIAKEPKYMEQMAAIEEQMAVAIEEQMAVIAKKEKYMAAIK